MATRRFLSTLLALACAALLVSAGAPHEGADAAATGGAPRAPKRVGAPGEVHLSEAARRPSPLASDSALDELAAGRFWHAARLLRAEGVADGGPGDVLTLARAEAGWENWSAVGDLLADRPWLDELEGAAGRYLSGRAHEERGRWAEAAEAYRAYLASSPADGDAALAARARRARAAWHAEDVEGALASLDLLRPSPVLRSWVAVDLSLDAAERGRPDLLALSRSHVVEPRAVSTLWRAEGDAFLTAGDTAAAVEAFGAAAVGQTGGRRAAAQAEAAMLRLAGGDSAVARAMLERVFADLDGSVRDRAAQALHDLGGQEPEGALELARVLDRAGDGARALAAYDRAWRALREEGGALPERARLERARMMATVRARQDEALEEFRDIRATTGSERVGARNLEVWAAMRRRQGLGEQVTTLRRWLVEEYPGSDEAAEVVWGRGSNAEAGGRLDEALGHYGFLEENARTHTRAGEARMRMGQIHLRRGNLEAAVEVFERYVRDFPDGRRWQEASYWAGRTRLELGDSARARTHLERVLTQPIEYYAVMAADLLGIPYAVDLPVGPAPREPGWLSEGLARLDLLVRAGLERGAESEIARLRERAHGERPVMIRLAEALIERGRTIDGINIGWAVLQLDGTWDRHLLRVTYPFPYEELVRREAAEWGVDVFTMAAIIRQESAFKADIVSRAGAVGLMQVMPPTGAQLARAHGPEGFTEEALTRPEINLHLGAAFFVDMSRRYDEVLPLVLSAYNAGPTRATRWRRYPEASDPLRFTERIPFVETRGYVKSVRRNLGLYRVLYGQD